MPKMPKYGDGFARMKKRLGKANTEKLRQQVIADQTAMRETVYGEIKEARDRTTYKDYPPTSTHPEAYTCQRCGHKGFGAWNCLQCGEPLMR